MEPVKAGASGPQLNSEIVSVEGPHSKNVFIIYTACYKSHTKYPVSDLLRES